MGTNINASVFIWASELSVYVHVCPQYVEKLEKMVRFVIKEKALTLEDLDDLWAAQSGKHEAIVKNVHDLLAKLAWDFAPEQLDHLFDCFQVRNGGTFDR